jgi:hypothetical protein
MAEIQAVQDAKAEQKRAKAEQERAAQAAKIEKERIESVRCALDLGCTGEKFNIESTVACRPLVERLAKNNFEWTDRWFEPKFSHYRWKSKERGVVTYIGDKIKYQNGFGAWTFHIYECDFDTRNKRVVDVRAAPGRI